MQTLPNNTVEIWGGMECTVNRVGDQYFDQATYYGDKFDQSIHLYKDLGIKKVRFPILWEKHQPSKHLPVNWDATKKSLEILRSDNIDIIAGLVHHGSGPAFVHMLEPDFAEGLAEYALQVAGEFPWIEYYTPVNEPVTTARFCGLYGLWYPHEQNDGCFCRILINECKGTVLAMQAIRRINPGAKLVQTDDLGKIHSTPLLQYQADFENQRRWLSFDLLCGKVDDRHPLWNYLLGAGIGITELEFFLANKCEPHIIGLNHYLTSERFLDENIECYPAYTHGSNSKCKYADVEAVRVGSMRPDGPYKLLREAWERYNLPIAVTEVHLYCTRDEQMRWIDEVWQAANRLKTEGADFRAITFWAISGSFGWNKLLTQPAGDYEPGVFDVSGGEFRRTILGEMIISYAKNAPFRHPVLNSKGWWNRKCRVLYGQEQFFNADNHTGETQPLLIVERADHPDELIHPLCELRGIAFIKIPIYEAGDLNAGMITRVAAIYRPWAVVYSSEVLGIADGKPSGKSPELSNAIMHILSMICTELHIKLQFYRSDGFEAIRDYPFARVTKRTGNKPKAPGLHAVNNAPESRVAHLLEIRFNEVMTAPGGYNTIFFNKLVNGALDLLIDNEQGVWQMDDKGNMMRTAPVCDDLETHAYIQEGHGGGHPDSLSRQVKRPGGK